MHIYFIDFFYIKTAGKRDLSQIGGHSKKLVFLVIYAYIFQNCGLRPSQCHTESKTI